MIDSELPFSYDKICTNVLHTLSEYDQYEAKIPRKEIEQSLNKMYQKQGRIREKLDIAESNAIDIVDNWESFNQWFHILKDTNKEMDHKEKEDETELGRLRLAFSSNANQLKSLEGDILSCCRKLPDTKESPQVIRLKCVYSNAKEYLNERSQVLSDITNELKEADDKYDKNQKENISLTQQNDEFQKQLDLFSNSESFKLVQDARKHILVEKEWNEKKSKLLTEIENSTKELENYLGNKDQSLRNLVLESNKQDQEAARLQLKYNEMMQDVINEGNISNTNRSTVMKQLNIELERLKQNQLRKESNITRSEVRTLKNKGDRLVSKLKMEISNSSRTFSQTIAKLTEPKPNTNSNIEKKSISNNAPRFKNFKGKKKKSTSKSPKKRKIPTPPAPKEPPPRVYSLQELALMKLQEDKEKYTLFLQSKFEPEIDELKQFLERKVNIHKELLQQELSAILNSDKRQREILMANKVRIQQRISEKDIEISSLNAELATFEDMTRDYQLNCIQLEKKNEELRKRSLEIIDPSKFIEIRKNIESLDSFISQTKEYIEILNTKMDDKIEASNQNKSKIHDIDNLKNVKLLPRSKSINDIHLLDQQKFTRKPKDEIKKERKTRTESSLSFLSQFQQSKQINLPKVDFSKPVLSSPTVSTNPTPQIMTYVAPTQPIGQIELIEPTKGITKSVNIDEKSQITSKENNENIFIENCTYNTVNEKQETEIEHLVITNNSKEEEEDKDQLTLSTPHFNEFISSSSMSSTSSKLFNPNTNSESTVNDQSNQPKPPSVSSPTQEEEEKPEIITKVESENPSINVTQPPHCQASKPKSQLQHQIQPPKDELHFIRKAPTFQADMRAFTIEARVSTTTTTANQTAISTSSSSSNPSTPPASPKSHQHSKPPQIQTSSSKPRFILNTLPTKSPRDETCQEPDSNTKMIEQSTDSYRIISGSDSLQLQEGKPHVKKPLQRSIKKSQKKQSDQLVLLSVTPMSLSNQNENVQSNTNECYVKQECQTVSASDKKRGKSASKEKRFTIYTSNDDKNAYQPIIFGQRRRAMMQIDSGKESNYSAFGKRSMTESQRIGGKVRVTKQKRGKSVTKSFSSVSVKVTKLQK